jgi:WXG100 family type VII secretion target
MAHMSNEFGQAHGALTRAAGMVMDAKQDFDGLSKTLDGQIANLQGKWAGAGGAAFFQLHAAWTETQKVIVSALNEFHDSLVKTEKDNTSTDEAQGQNFSNFQSRIG